jgi:ferric-dicitrate binding protein FerR (iron transport regulator)
MQRYKENIPRMLANFIMNKQSDQENKELDEWLQSKSNQSLFDRLSDKNKILKKSFDYDQFEVEKAWDKFEKKLDSIPNTKSTKKPSFNYRTWLAYASVIVLPIALALFVYIEAPKYSDLVTQQTVIPPGESNAIIYLADGRHVNLKNDTSSIIKGKDNLLVEKEDNVLKVNADNLKTQDLNRMNKIVTPVSGEYQLVLPDGTKVWLNADSYLEFPSKFSSKYRKVIAKGELYFDVASNKDWPFIVESNGMELKVLGTEFNLRSYTDEENIVSTLVEGSVEIRNTKGDALLLKPGRKATLNRTDLKMSED